MKITSISDTHGSHSELESKWKDCGHWNKVIESSILIHSGDLTINGSKNELNSAFSWLESIAKQGPTVFVISGNHDFGLDPNWRATTPIGKERHTIRYEMGQGFNPNSYEGVNYLCDSGTNFNGIGIWGTPVTPWYHDWAWNRNESQMRYHCSKIPSGLDILITHGPALGILDKSFRSNENVGCGDILNRISISRPRLHLFGHIHEGYGSFYNNGTLHVNVASLDGLLNLSNLPVLIEIPEDGSDPYIISQGKM